MKKEKRMLFIEKVVGLAVCLVAAGWVLYSVYDKVTDTSGAEVVQVDTVIDTSALDDYTSGLHVDETEEDAEIVDTDAEADETAEEDAAADAEEVEADAEETDTEEAPEEDEAE